MKNTIVQLFSKVVFTLFFTRNNSSFRPAWINCFGSSPPGAYSYFLTQRVKFTAKNYEKKLAARHHMIVYAMKCKQRVEPEMVQKLRNAVEECGGLSIEK